jgi:hypothetical protein
MGYRPVFSDSAVEFFATLPRRGQRKLLDRAQELAGDPFLIPDFRSRDEDDRDLAHVLIDICFSVSESIPRRKRS